MHASEKMNTQHTAQAYVMIHLAVILFGFTAILGKLIQLPGATIVWYRMLLTGMSLCFIPSVFRHLQKIPKKDILKIAGIGILVSLHWVAFYEAIKYANASIVLSCMATVSLFTALIEPLVFKSSIKPAELILGFFVIIGFVFIFGFTGESYYVGIVIAIISALLAAIFSVFNKTVVVSHNIYAIILIQFIVGFAFLSAMSPVYISFFPQSELIPSRWDWIYLWILALICTTLAYTLNMYALKYLSAFTTNLAINLEPVYGILMAYFILDEGSDLNVGFYVGSGIILIAVLLHAWMSRRKKGK